MLAAPREHVDTSPLVLSVHFVGPGTSAQGCPGYEPMSPDWDVWWILHDSSAVGPSRGPRPGPDPPLIPFNDSPAFHGGFAAPPQGAGRTGRVAVVPASLLKGDWQKVTVAARAKALRDQGWYMETVDVHVWHMPLCQSATVALEGVLFSVASTLLHMRDLLVLQGGTSGAVGHGEGGLVDEPRRAATMSGHRNEFCSLRTRKYYFSAILGFDLGWGSKPTGMAHSARTVQTLCVCACTTFQWLMFGSVSMSP